MIRIAWVLALIMFHGSSFLHAADREERTFAVIVEGKSVGSATMTFEPNPEGAENFSISVEAKGRISLISFHYVHSSSETWKDGRLVTIESKTNDDGKKTKLAGKSSEAGLRLTVNGKDKNVRADALPTSGWRLPVGLANGARFVTVDTEDGTETTVQVEDRGVDRVMLDRKAISARKYKLTGKDLDAEWWFDSDGRPVRQLLVWDGHKVTLDLTSIKR